MASRVSSTMKTVGSMVMPTTGTWALITGISIIQPAGATAIPTMRRRFNMAWATGTAEATGTADTAADCWAARSASASAFPLSATAGWGFGGFATGGGGVGGWWCWGGVVWGWGGVCALLGVLGWCGVPLVV